MNGPFIISTVLKARKFRFFHYIAAVSDERNRMSCEWNEYHMREIYSRTRAIFLRHACRSWENTLGRFSTQSLYVVQQNRVLSHRAFHKNIYFGEQCQGHSLDQSLKSSACIKV